MKEQIGHIDAIHELAKENEIERLKRLVVNSNSELLMYSMWGIYILQMCLIGAFGFKDGLTYSGVLIFLFTLLSQYFKKRLFEPVENPYALN